MTERVEYLYRVGFRIVERIQITANLPFTAHVVGKPILSARTLEGLQTYHIQFIGVDTKEIARVMIVLVRQDSIFLVVIAHGKEHGYVNVVCDIEHVGLQSVMLRQSHIIDQIMVFLKVLGDVELL